MEYYSPSGVCVLSAGETIRVFVVDDHQVVRVGLRTMLESEPDIVVVGTAASGQEALRRLPSLAVDVLLTAYAWRK
jgi:two-component system, NarL family, response regulator DevR